MPSTPTATPIAFDQSGSGPSDVLLVPGLLAAGEDWTAQVPRLVARGHRVTVLHPRGTGATSTTASSFGLGELVADVRAVREAAGIDGPHHLLGAGIGAAVAQELALAEPDRLTSLTLVGGWAVADRQLRALLASWIWAAERAQEVDELLGVVAASAYGPRLWNDGSVDDAIVATAHATPRGAYPRLREAFAATVRAGLSVDTSDRLGALEVPTLLLVGALDAVAPERHSRLLAAQLPHAELEVLGATGHALLQSRPDAVAATIDRFLTSVATPALAARG